MVVKGDKMSVTEEIVQKQIAEESEKQPKDGFFSKRRTRSGNPGPNPPSGSQTVYGDEHPDNNEHHRKSCCVLS
jgi:hypothetical protein